MLSLPNFSRKASASTIAAMDSPITAAAGTAQESARSLKARVGSPVARSTVRRVLAIVEIGFIAAEITTGSPLVIPPSKPPRRLVFRARRPSSDKISSWTSLEAGSQLEAHPELDALYGVYGHHGRREPGVQFVAPVDVRSEARRTTAGDNDELASEGVTRVARRVDLRLHLLRDLGVRAAHL